MLTDKRKIVIVNRHTQNALALFELTEAQLPALLLALLGVCDRERLTINLLRRVCCVWRGGTWRAFAAIKPFVKTTRPDSFHKRRECRDGIVRFLEMNIESLGKGQKWSAS